MRAVPRGSADKGPGARGQQGRRRATARGPLSLGVGARVGAQLSPLPVRAEVTVLRTQVLDGLPTEAGPCVHRTETAPAPAGTRLAFWGAARGLACTC